MQADDSRVSGDDPQPTSRDGSVAANSTLTSVVSQVRASSKRTLRTCQLTVHRLRRERLHFQRAKNCRPSWVAFSIS